MAIRGVIIDAGHGGKDPGASGNGIIEKDLTLKISLYMHDRLDELGVPNVLVRDSDITLDPSERVKIINAFFGTGSDILLISNHINAGGRDTYFVITYNYS